MINYNDIKIGRTVTGIAMSGKEVTGEVTNVMKGFRMATVKCGEDRLSKDIIEFENITNIEKVD
jgi:hypothetical protein